MLTLQTAENVTNTALSAVHGLLNHHHLLLCMTVPNNCRYINMIHAFNYAILLFFLLTAGKELFLVFIYINDL